MGHNAQVGRTAVQAPEVLLTVARVRKEPLILTFEICQEVKDTFQIYEL
jgi:hypothetical protein